VQRIRLRKTFEIQAPRGHLAVDPDVGEPLAAALRFVRERTSPEDHVLTLPQATSINFLAERKYPLPDEIVHPGFLSGDREAEAIRTIDALRVPLILVANWLTPEFRDRAFGIHYNQELMRWITEHYHAVARFDSATSRGAQMGDRPFFIVAYERNERVP